jgi:hypothetical protein
VRLDCQCSPNPIQWGDMRDLVNDISAYGERLFDTTTGEPTIEFAARKPARNDIFDVPTIVLCDSVTAYTLPIVVSATHPMDREFPMPEGTSWADWHEALGWPLTDAEESAYGEYLSC